MAQRDEQTTENSGLSTPMMIGIVSVVSVVVIALLIMFTEGGLGSDPADGYEITPEDQPLEDLPNLDDPDIEPVAEDTMLEDGGADPDSVDTDMDTEEEIDGPLMNDADDGEEDEG